MGIAQAVQKRLTCFVALDCLAPTYYEYASARQCLARLASETFLNSLKLYRKTTQPALTH